MIQYYTITTNIKKYTYVIKYYKIYHIIIYLIYLRIT